MTTLEMTTLEKITIALQPMRPVLADEARRWERKVSFLLAETCREIDAVQREYDALLNEHNKLLEAISSELAGVKKEEVQSAAR